MIIEEIHSRLVEFMKIYNRLTFNMTNDFLVWRYPPDPDPEPEPEPEPDKRKKKIRMNKLFKQPYYLYPDTQDPLRGEACLIDDKSELTPYSNAWVIEQGERVKQGLRVPLHIRSGMLIDMPAYIRDDAFNNDYCVGMDVLYDVKMAIEWTIMNKQAMDFDTDEEPVPDSGTPPQPLPPDPGPVVVTTTRTSTRLDELMQEGREKFLEDIEKIKSIIPTNFKVRKKYSPVTENGDGPDPPELPDLVLVRPGGIIGRQKDILGLYTMASEYMENMDRGQRMFTDGSMDPLDYEGEA